MSPRLMWRAFIRALIVLLLIALGLSLLLGLFPSALQAFILLFPIPGAVEVPPPGPTPPPPVIDAPRGSPPGGYLALNGVYDGGTRSFGCGFLLDLEDGQVVGLSTAHSAQPRPPGLPAELRSPGQELAAALSGQIAYGRAFVKENFSSDVVVWGVEKVTWSGSILKPDPRGQPQAGEAVWVYSRFETAQGGSQGWPGVITRVKRQSAWVQLEDAFYPGGYSGCPVVSQHTGRLVGMVVAGDNQPPVVMGLNLVSALVERARAALGEGR